MSENKDIERAESEGLPPVEKSDADSLASAKSSVEPAPKEPKQTRAKSAGAKPAAAPVAPYAVVGAGPTDSVAYSAAKPPTKTGSRKSLTVHHLQRRLKELGYDVAYADRDGTYGTLTEEGVKAWQKDNGHEATGLLTREQFAAVFDGDVNVTVTIDTHKDHA